MVSRRIYICIYVCKNICIYIVDAETPGYLYFYSDYVCIRGNFRFPRFSSDREVWNNTSVLVLPRITNRSGIRFDLAHFFLLRVTLWETDMIRGSPGQTAYSSILIWLHCPNIYAAPR